MLLGQHSKLFAIQHGESFLRGPQQAAAHRRSAHLKLLPSIRLRSAVAVFMSSSLFLMSVCCSRKLFERLSSFGRIAPLPSPISTYIRPSSPCHVCFAAASAAKVVRSTSEAAWRLLSLRLHLRQLARRRRLDRHAAGDGFCCQGCCYRCQSVRCRSCSASACFTSVRLSYPPPSGPPPSAAFTPFR